MEEIAQRYMKACESNRVKGYVSAIGISAVSLDSKVEKLANAEGLPSDEPCLCIYLKKKVPSYTKKARKPWVSTIG